MQNNEKKANQAARDYINNSKHGSLLCELAIKHMLAAGWPVSQRCQMERPQQGDDFLTSR